jgi:hypothetical protein
MVIPEPRIPAVAALMIAARHFLAPAFSPTGLLALALLAAMARALHCLAAALALLTTLGLLLLRHGLLLTGTGRGNDLTTAGSPLLAAAALHLAALAALALAALAALCSLGEARAHRKPSEHRTQQENSDYR